MSDSANVQIKICMSCNYDVKIIHKSDYQIKFEKNLHGILFSVLSQLNSQILDCFASFAFRFFAVLAKNVLLVLAITKNF